MRTAQARTPKRKTSHGRNGPTSWSVLNPMSVFEALEIGPGKTFLDIGSGRGDYAVHAAEAVGEHGTVHALELDKHYAETLALRAAERRLHNVHVVVADMTEPLPLRDNSIDCALACTVFHFLDPAKQGHHVFSEVRRALKPGGVFVVVECSMEDLSYGPPAHMRNNPDEFDAPARSAGLQLDEYVPMGFTYRLKFRKPEEK